MLRQAVWCERGELNPHGKPLDSKSSASTNSATLARIAHKGRSITRIGKNRKAKGREAPQAEGLAGRGRGASGPGAPETRTWRGPEKRRDRSRAGSAGFRGLPPSALQRAGPDGGFRRYGRGSERRSGGGSRLMASAHGREPAISPDSQPPRERLPIGGGGLHP